MTLRVVWTNRFKKDYKTAIKRGLDIKKLDDVITILATGKAPLSKQKDHALSGDYAGFRECHIEPDWLLIYAIDGTTLVLTLTRTGSHSDLFD